MNLLKRLFGYIYHNFEYRSFAKIRRLRKRCTLCKQWFVKRINDEYTWYEPTNGVIVDPKCTCHRWHERKKRGKNENSL